ncbi:Lrp/AsnC family transcriptional regulator [Streptomyces griseorubiginosus]|uniref:Lrp/AsnC family transcriptional regulator n=1 Tax=Streptomyces griseorubiginosus TaxID=67304 RepID=UPI00368F252F
MQNSTGIDEVDLAVIHAVERAPRAPWALIASAVGIDASTAARRWDRLTGSGIAWVTCYPLLLRTQVPAIVELVCTPDGAPRAADLIARDPQALFVDITTGDADVLVTVLADSIQSLSTYVLDRLGTAEGVTSVRTHPILTVHTEGNLVGSGALDPQALTQLPAPTRGRLSLSAAPGGIDDLDWRICLALSRDGRRPVSALSADVGAAATTVQRRIQKLTRLGALRMMVEVATSRTPTPVTVWYSARIPARLLDEAASTLSAMPSVKAVTSVAGRNSLYFKATFRDLEDIRGFDVRLDERLPEAEMTDRKVVLRPVRLMSRLTDAFGHAQDVVSCDIRPP